ncbi:B-cell receptor CD22-like isoform X3 [Lepisosteus oculatus]
MGVEDSLRSWGATLLILPGVLCGQWAVWYPERSVCAVRGSSVVFNCSYDYPNTFTQYREYKLKVTTVMWCYNDEDCIPGPNTVIYIYHSGHGPVRFNYWGRVEYLGDKQKTCTVKIKEIRTSDQGTYRFRFETNDPKGKWAGDPGVSLSVTEFKVWRSPSGETAAVREGDSVTLTCDTVSCSPAQTQLTWFKNDQPLPHTQTAANTLHFNPVSSGHSGLYSCAPRDTAGSRSPPFPLDVQYAPRSTSVSISPSGEIAEGSSVTLTCSSSANPPVKNYSWFKGNRNFVLQEKSKLLSFLKISPDDSGQYFCVTNNSLGEKQSAPIQLDVKYAPRSTSVSISPSGEIAEGSSVTLTCSSSANPPVKNYSWFKINGTGPLYKGPNYTIINISSADSGQYYCEAQNEIGSNRSAAGTVDVLSKSSLSLVPALAGAFAVVMVVGAAVAVICIWRRKKRLPAEEGVMTDGRQGCSRAPGHQTAEEENMYSNIEGLPVTGREQARGTAVQQSEVSYATVQFRPRTAQEPEGRDLTAGDLVIYSSVTQGSIS